MGDDKEYNVSQYSENELYNILDVNNPTDRELEAKILQFINKYEESDHPQAKTMKTFFEDIYDHFFSEEEDQEKEGMVNMSDDNSTTKNTQLTKTNNTTTIDEYMPSELNPFIKETIKRMVFIDSQYRDYDNFFASSDFKFDLTETIHRAVSMKLHSFSIPYCWYNISNMYNTNYFLFEGNMEEIKDVRIPVQIKAGIYDETKLLNVLNEALANINVNGFSIGSSQIIYSTVELKIKFILNFTYTRDGTTYNAKDFKVVFYKSINGENPTFNFDHAQRNTTLGWIMGFHNFTEYGLDPQGEQMAGLEMLNNYIYTDTSETVEITGNSVLDLNTTKTIYLALNEYASNRMNDGLVTIGQPSKVVKRPMSQSITTKNADNTTNASISRNDAYGNFHTENALQASNAILNENTQHIQGKTIYSPPPQIGDIFAAIPIKLSGLRPGALFSEFGGALGENKRNFFGAVHLKKFHVQLYNEKGQIIELNGGNWNFSLTIESLYNYNNK